MLRRRNAAWPYHECDKADNKTLLIHKKKRGNCRKQSPLHR